MEFLNEEHKERFGELKRKGNIKDYDKERLVAMYILSGFDETYRKADEIYDFKKDYFNVERVDGEVEFEIAMCTSGRKLALLAYELFSSRDAIYVNDLFKSLDSNNRRLALNAIEYAFS